MNEYNPRKYFVIDAEAELGYYVWIIPYDRDNSAGKVSLLRPENYDSELLWDPTAIAPTWWNGETNTVTWYMNLPGDCDQNTQVDPGDLVPISQNYLTEGPFDVNDVLYIVDCNHDGIINSDDVQVILNHFLNHVLQYNIYTSDNVLDYPSCPVANSTTNPIAHIDLCNAEYTEQRRLYYSYAFPDGALKRYVWVRPYCYAGEGTPGDLIDTQIAQ